ncbi:polysaccharide deacetylase family protein [Mesobacillus foraminis]|uniref:polysaccharide deacetylase family protein n=1 Tax=Mesobacillus foraminis TaxID=279826 RepID=UPI000EF52FBD|nr:polysaccharide deacetylase family protein [Mesobacillus foraminis]
MKYAAAAIFAALLLVSCQSGKDSPETDSREANQGSDRREYEQAAVLKEERVTEQELDTKQMEQGKRYSINPETWAVEPTGDAPKEVVLLTIDDAPANYSVEMAKTLKSLGVKAIFFVNGHLLDRPGGENALKKIYELGFPIGNHTYHHQRLTELTEAQQREEIVSLNRRVEGIVGQKPKFFRAPFGQMTPYSRNVAREEKMTLMNWSYGYDWEKEYQTPEALADIMVNTPYLKNGANLLMHDRQWTSQALEGIVKGIQEKGFTIVDPEEIETSPDHRAS